MLCRSLMLLLLLFLSPCLCVVQRMRGGDDFHLRASPDSDDSDSEDAAKQRRRITSTLSENWRVYLMQLPRQMLNEETQTAVEQGRSRFHSHRLSLLWSCCRHERATRTVHHA